jgi:hypothetical protein
MNTMDNNNSVILCENTAFKAHVEEMIKSSWVIIERRTNVINQELNRMREDYVEVFNRCTLTT